MLLEHSFSIPVGINDAWAALLDIEQVASCMPGAQLDEVTEDDFGGSVKVKLGPIGLTYKGRACFTEKDAATHRAVIDARGQDARGNGTAAATVTATLVSLDGVSTRVDIATDLNITGRPAQFGRGMLEEVSNKLLGQFADCLSRKLRGESDVTGPAPGSAPTQEAAPPISLVSTRQWVTTAAAAAAALVVLLVVRRLRR